MSYVIADRLERKTAVHQPLDSDTTGAALLKQAISRLGLTARAYHRVLKVARTIADLADERLIASAHVAEAIQFRRFDRS